MGESEAHQCPDVLPDGFGGLTDKTKRHVRNVAASAATEGTVLTDDDIECGYRIVQGKLDVDDYIERIYSTALTNDR